MTCLVFSLPLFHSYKFPLNTLQDLCRKKRKALCSLHALSVELSNEQSVQHDLPSLRYQPKPKRALKWTLPVHSVCRFSRRRRHIIVAVGGGSSSSGCRYHLISGLTLDIAHTYTPHRLPAQEKQRDGRELGGPLVSGPRRKVAPQVGYPIKHTLTRAHGRVHEKQQCKEEPRGHSMFMREQQSTRSSEHIYSVCVCCVGPASLPSHLMVDDKLIFSCAYVTVDGLSFWGEREREHN